MDTHTPGTAPSMTRIVLMSMLGVVLCGAGALFAHYTGPAEPTVAVSSSPTATQTECTNDLQSEIRAAVKRARR